MPPEPGEITLLLRQWQAGDETAESRLFQALLPELRRIAGRYFRRERAGHTLQPTVLVNEAFLRLAAARHITFQDRNHFLAISARIMRRYLVDYARAGPGVNFVAICGLPEPLAGGRDRAEMAIEVDRLLHELEKESPRQRKVVEMKFYLGLSDQEAAGALNLTLHTLQREWYRARRWLFERLNSKSCKAANATNG